MHSVEACRVWSRSWRRPWERAPRLRNPDRAVCSKLQAVCVPFVRRTQNFTLPRFAQVVSECSDSCNRAGFMPSVLRKPWRVELTRVAEN